MAAALPTGSPGPPTPGSVPPRPGPLRALAAPLSGAGFVRRHPALLPWVLLPFAVDLLLLVLLVAAALAWGGGLAPDLAGPWWGWLDWLRGPVAWSLRNLLRLLAVLAAFYLTGALAGAVNAPLHDLLSERTENLARGSPEPARPWSLLLPDAIRATRAAVFLLLVQAAVMVPLFLLSFTALGAPLFAAAGAWFAGFGVADIPLARKRIGGRERLRRAGRRWVSTLALGLPVSLLPPLQPLAVVGATLLHLEDPEG